MKTDFNKWLETKEARKKAKEYMDISGPEDFEVFKFMSFMRRRFEDYKRNKRGTDG